MLFCFVIYMIGRCANGAPQSVSDCIMIKCSLVILRTVIISNATFCCKTLGPGISIHLDREDPHQYSLMESSSPSVSGSTHKIPLDKVFRNDFTQ